jgi:hypothetical protein
VNPKPYQKVEILIDGYDHWVLATFYAADFIVGDDYEDEVWWMDYFMLESGDTIPDDVTQMIELPQWREIDDAISS